MIPGDARWWRIGRGEAELTAEEVTAGWHFCPDFDMDLLGPDDQDRDGRCLWCGERVSFLSWTTSQVK